MDSNRSFEIETKRIKDGTIFDFDLTDSNGRVILKAGRPFDESIRKRLPIAGIEKLTIRLQPQATSTSQLLLDSYPPESVARLQEMLSATERSFDSFFQELLQDRRASCRDLLRQVDRLIAEATNETSTLLGVLAARVDDGLQQESQRVQTRSTRLSCLSIIAGTELGLNPEDIKSISLAALIHDIAFLLHPEWQDPEYRTSRRKQFLDAFTNHPIESTRYLRLVSKLSQHAIMLISQIHEQLDGSGFPYGLRGLQIHPAARVMNVVDAYLEIVNPTFRKIGLVPSDALAHLCFHAAEGVFDRDATRGLIDTISFYPIGTEVDMSDARQAIVIRTNPGKPLEPVVRFLDGSHEIADLARTNLQILAPVTAGKGFKRLDPKKEMLVPLWNATTNLDFFE
jgi:HD-GYP domain-containing protein (c-di-GMP phosphodiesterase class II)